MLNSSEKVTKTTVTVIIIIIIIIIIKKVIIILVKLIYILIWHGAPKAKTFHLQQCDSALNVKLINEALISYIKFAVVFLSNL